MNVVETKGIRKVYPSRNGLVEAVKDVTLTIRAGEILGFLGPNGAGKTTTIKMLSGLIKRDAGSVDIMGKDPEADRSALRNVGAVLEGNRNLYWRLTSIENLEYFGTLRGLKPKEARKRGDELLERFDLQDKRMIEVRKLSRGMQQKVAIAAALLHQPKLVLMDEPTLGLDVETAEIVKSMMGDMAANGQAVLLTTHQLGVAEEISHRLAIIRDGEIIVEEETESLLQRFAGDAYSIEVLDALDAERTSRLQELGAWVTDGRVTYLGDPAGVYQLLRVLDPLPLKCLAQDREDLTGVFLKLVKKGNHAESHIS